MDIYTHRNMLTLLNIDDWPVEKRCGWRWRVMNGEWTMQQITQLVREYIDDYGSAPALTMGTARQARKIYNYINTVTGCELSPDTIKEIRALLVETA